MKMQLAAQFGCDDVALDMVKSKYSWLSLFKDCAVDDWTKRLPEILDLEYALLIVSSKFELQ